MKNFIYPAIIVVIFAFWQKQYIKAWIIQRIKKSKGIKNNAVDLKKKNDISPIFAPVNTKRDFVVPFTLIEKGDGTITIEISKITKTTEPLEISKKQKI